MNNSLDSIPHDFRKNANPKIKRCSHMFLLCFFRYNIIWMTAY